MWYQRIAVLAAIGSLAAVCIPLLVYQQVRFAPSLKDTERAVANFSPAPLVVPRITWQPVILTSPVTPPLLTPTAQPEGAGTATATKPPPVPAAVSAPSVTFILHDGGKDMAIINGNVLKAGDRYQEWRVERIERNRVLLNGRKGPQWISLQ